MCLRLGSTGSALNRILLEPLLFLRPLLFLSYLPGGGGEFSLEPTLKLFPAEQIACMGAELDQSHSKE